MTELRLHLAPAVVRFLESTWPRAAARAERRAALLAVPGARHEAAGDSPGLAQSLEASPTAPATAIRSVPSAWQPAAPLATEPARLVPGPDTTFAAPPLASAAVETGGNRVVAAGKPLVSADESLVSATKPLVSVTKPSVSVTKPLVSVTKPLVSVTKPLVSVTKPLVSVTKPLVSVDEALVSVNEALVSADEALVSASEALVSANEALVSANEALVSSNEALVSDGEALVFTNAEVPAAGMRLSPEPLVRRPRTSAEIVRTGPAMESAPAPDQAPRPGATPLEPLQTPDVPPRLQTPASRIALSRLMARVAERSTRQNGLVAGMPGPETLWPVTLPQPPAAPALIGTRIAAAAGGPDQPAASPAGPQQPLKPEPHSLAESELRRMLARIIRNDALRYGLDLKER